MSVFAAICLIYLALLSFVEVMEEKERRLEQENHMPEVEP